MGRIGIDNLGRFGSIRPDSSPFTFTLDDPRTVHSNYLPKPSRVSAWLVVEVFASACGARSCQPPPSQLRNRSKLRKQSPSSSEPRPNIRTTTFFVPRGAMRYGTCMGPAFSSWKYSHMLRSDMM